MCRVKSLQINYVVSNWSHGDCVCVCVCIMYQTGDNFFSTSFFGNMMSAKEKIHCVCGIKIGWNKGNSKINTAIKVQRLLEVTGCTTQTSAMIIQLRHCNIYIVCLHFNGFSVRPGWICKSDAMCWSRDQRKSSSAHEKGRMKSLKKPHKNGQYSLWNGWKVMWEREHRNIDTMAIASKKERDR